MIEGLKYYDPVYFFCILKVNWQCGTTSIWPAVTYRIGLVILR